MLRQTHRAALMLRNPSKLLMLSLAVKLQHNYTLNEAIALQVFVTAHQSVADVSKQMLQELKRHNYVTPTNYLETVRGYRCSACRFIRHLACMYAASDCNHNSKVVPLGSSASHAVLYLDSRKPEPAGACTTVLNLCQLRLLSIRNGSRNNAVDAAGAC